MGKWKDESLPLRKSLVKIRKFNIADLIERDMFTLIGRVTSPSIQKTRALVDFFLQEYCWKNNRHIFGSFPVPVRVRV